MLLTQLLRGRGRRISEFEFRLVDRVSFRTAGATQRNLVSTNQKTNKQIKNKTKQKQEISYITPVVQRK